ncbi:hypothetical protein GW17_00006137 [Ensete ventricosum]|nr:hypothetical protein GW17_00006137 [Ensete ventricosum]RZR86325.1 hypothetical protein BHM03_00013521 [Ensete ventricosum]
MNHGLSLLFTRPTKSNQKLKMGDLKKLLLEDKTCTLKRSIAGKGNHLKSRRGRGKKDKAEKRGHVGENPKRLGLLEEV